MTEADALGSLIRAEFSGSILGQSQTSMGSTKALARAASGFVMVELTVVLGAGVFLLITRAHSLKLILKPPFGNFKIANLLMPS